MGRETYHQGKPSVFAPMDDNCFRVSDEKVYSFIAKRLSKVIEENPDEFYTNVDYIIGVQIKTEKFSEDWYSLEKHLSKECIDIISRLVDTAINCN